ncbi:MAG: AmmeMemoRadiSam system protein A [Eubacteriales bacterium]|nr:AmmeMemoRadiSam system protein A [Eubacteriales bacterium]
MPVIGSIMVPHPPLIVPAVGGGEEKQVAETIKSYEKAAGFIAGLKPDTLVVISPHAVMYSDYFHISPGNGASGSFSDFMAPDIRFEVDYDIDLVSEICRIAESEDFPAGTLGERNAALDHGTMVPLWFLTEAYKENKLISKEKTNLRIIRIGLSGLPLRTHYVLGQIIQKAASRLDRRIAVIASGDLSHKLQSYGPYGFAEEGPEYDRRIMDVMGRAAFGELFDFDEAFCEKAAECGHRSFVIMAGTMDGYDVSPEKLSHEDVTGVGYGIVTFRTGEPDGNRKYLEEYYKKEDAAALARKNNEDACVRLARLTLEYYFEHGRKMALPDDISGGMKDKRCGVFVSLHEYGSLRGCIGTIEPTRGSFGEEIIQNAISAAFHDPRFDPLKREELNHLEYSIDELSPIEVDVTEDMLDPSIYGVIVSKGSRMGLLLPDLDGVDTVEQQISIAKQKAGIGKNENVRLSRFTVTRHK